MIPAAFAYARAGSLAEAVELLAQEGDARILAGGHSLIPHLRLRIARPTLVVDIGRLHDLRYVREDDEEIAIGALTRHSELVHDAVLASRCRLVASVAEGIGDPQVRHRGTIGGSIAHADPASDFCTLALTLDATLIVRGPAGERSIPPAEFFRGPFETALERSELLTEIRVPAVDRGVYLKYVRRAADWATVGVAAAVVDGRTHVGLASMGPTPLRARGVEQALADGATPADAAERAAEGTDPPSDVSGSSTYRAHLARVLVRRALEQL